MKRALALLAWIAVACALWIIWGALRSNHALASATAPASSVAPDANASPSSSPVVSPGASFSRAAWHESIASEVLDTTPHESSKPESAVPSTHAGRIAGRVREVDRELQSSPRRAPDSGAGAPIAGAAINAYLLRGGLELELGETTSLDDGSFELEVESLAALRRFEREMCVIELCVRAKGYITEWFDQRVSVVTGSMEGLDAGLTPGAVVRGRALEPSGAPAAFATVDSGRSRTRTRSDGRFELGPVGESGAREFAVRSSSGASAHRRVEIGGSDVEVGDLTLDFGPHLGGFLRRADGAPAPHTSFAFAVAPTDRVESADANEPTSIEIQELESNLIPRVAVETDDEGRFTVGDLQPIAYCVESDLHRAGAERFTPTRDDLELQVAGTWLDAQVLDENGLALPGARVTLRPIANPADRTRRSEAAEETTFGPEAIASFAVEPDTAYLASAEATGAQPCERKVAIGALGSTTRVVLELAELAEPAQLHVELGLPRGVAAHGYRAELCTLESNRPIVEFFGFECDERGESPPLPIGRYALRVKPYGSSVIDDFLYAEGDAPIIELERGAHVSVRVEFALGGRFTLRVDRGALGEEFHGASAELFDPRGRLESFEFEGPHGAQTLDSLCDEGGEADALGVLPIGRHRLRITTATQRVVERAFEIEEERRTTLVFAP